MSASDDVIWEIINNQFCAFKISTDKKQTFCRNEMNVTGFCNRQSCPLSNSRYATIRRHPTKDTLYLYMKTAERAHTPSRLWEKIKLSTNYARALEQIDERLIYWPKFMIHKCKQRLTRLTQVNIRTRRIAAEEARLGERLIPKLPNKVRNREEARERKAEAAARLERTIERELVERLRSGAYGDQPLNVSEVIWKKVLGAMEKDGQAKRDKNLDMGVESEDEEDQFEKEGVMAEEDESDLEKEVEYVSDVEESEDEGLDDIQDWLGSEDDDEQEDDEEDSEDSEGDAKGKAGDKRKRGRAVKMNSKRLKQKAVERPKVAEELTW